MQYKHLIGINDLVPGLAVVRPVRLETCPGLDYGR